MAVPMTRDEYMKMNYPRWIYKEGENPFIVQNAFEHAKWYKKGWTGPPLFFGDIEQLEKEIAQAKAELEEMEDRLAVMKCEQEEALKVVEGEGAKKEPEPEPAEQKEEVAAPAQNGKVFNKFSKK